MHIEMYEYKGCWYSESEYKQGIKKLRLIKSIVTLELLGVSYIMFLYWRFLWN